MQALEDDIQLDEELRKRNVFRRQMAVTAAAAPSAVEDDSSTSSSSSASSPAPSTCVSRPSTAKSPRPPPIDVSDFTPPHVDPPMLSDLNNIQGNLGTGSLGDPTAGVKCKHENKEWYQDVGTGIGSSMDVASSPVHPANFMDDNGNQVWPLTQFFSVSFL